MSQIRQTEDVLTLESGLEALQSSPEFRGPVEPVDGGYHNDHFALIYEDRADQFDAAAPFVRQGLERGERVMYVVEEGARADVEAAMRERGVDAADEPGALTLQTVEEVYLRDGSFHADEPTSFYAGAIEAAAEEFEGFRLAVDMAWMLREEVSVEDCMAYESEVNDVFDGEDAIALCQYDRQRFPPETLCDVVRVHPHLIYDSTVCHNVYYTPPEEFCGPDRPEHELDRMLGTLLDRTEARTELADRERYLRAQNEITADPDRSFEEKLRALFELGCERFDLELGALARVDPDADRFEIEHTSGDHEHFAPGVALPLSETYCTAAVAEDGVASVTDPVARGYENVTVHRNFGLRAYVGTFVEIEGGPDRTLFFVGSDHREPFSADDRAFLRLLGQWVTYELERHRRERTLERTVDSLEASNERLEQFAYAASHDLQEPLRMVSSYLQLIDRRYGDDLDEDAREYLEFAVDGAERMREMIDGLLEYSRVETRGDPLEPVDLDAILADVREDLRVRIEETGAEITADELPRVEGDGNQLRQVFQNLLENAITYSGDEPPRIEIAAEPRDPDRGGGTGPAWIVSVRDEGIGIDPDDQDRIFDVFHRLHSREAYRGTGIGLALCERIVERHGGDIRVDSEPGEGSTFHVVLPVADGGA